MTLVWRPGFEFDADASTYIEAVEAADEAASPGIGALETNTRYAINNFVIGCKQDGIWDAIKASCILAGARTLDGALVPLVGTAPTNYNFVAGDYNRETGLQGNGTDNYLDSGRDNSAEPQNDKHVSTYMSTHYTRDATRCAIGMGIAGSGNTQLVSTTSARFPRVNSAFGGFSDTTAVNGFEGASRSSSANQDHRYAQSTANYTINSSSPASGNILIFARGSVGSANAFANARIAFYSIGESLDLALLDARVTDLITAIGAAIP